MWPVELLTTVLSFALYVSCNPLLIPHAKRFDYGGDLAQSYDFVIIGGGQAGLVIASRLSEDSNTTVLVIEAGDTGEAVQDRISTPANTYLNGVTKSEYDWQYSTSDQAGLGGRSASWPRGKVLGGSSAINGMYNVRPSEIEVNAWSSLVDSDGAGAWSWKEYYNALEKSETFTQPSSDIAKLGGIQSDKQSPGAGGPIHSGFPGYTYDTVGQWVPALTSAGVTINPDPYSGKSWGGFVARSFIDPRDWKRSYSRSAYIDTIDKRSNLHILVKNTVTRIVFGAEQTATAVEFAESKDGAQGSVKVNKEVIVSAGSIGSPQVLMVSGVGPKDVLEAAKVEVLHELPGVGQHLQDHLSTLVIYKTNKDTSKKLYDGGLKTPEFLSYVNSAIAYLGSKFLFDDVSAFQKEVQAGWSDSHIPSTDSQVLAGAKAIFDAHSNTILPSDVGQVELLLGNMFADTVSIGVALQQPLSQGRVYINSASAFDYPVIDPGYLSHPADVVILRQGIKAARKVGTTAPLTDSLLEEISPGPSVTSDADIEKWLAGQVGTEYHPSSSCAMLPLDKGGVVDAKLKVHGLKNVRVADASVFPFVFTAHLGGAVYGLAEQAANIIRAEHNGVAAPGSSTPNKSNGSSNNNNSSSNNSNNSGTSSDGKKNGAVSQLPSSLWTSLFLITLTFWSFI